MNDPRYAWLVRKLLVSGGASIAPVPPGPMDRARAIAAVAQAIETRARRRRTARWAGGAVAAAAAVVGVFVGSHALGHVVARAPSQVASSGGPEIVAHPAAGGASVLVSGAQAPLVEGRSLASGSRIVTPPGGRATLSFSTGTSVALGEGADVTVGGDGGSAVLQLAGGVVDLHVAKLGAGQRFVVNTPDAEVEVRGTQFRVGLAAPDPGCGGGTTTRVTVTEGVVVVRHAGVESRVPAGEGWPAACWRTSVSTLPPTDAPLAMPPASRPLAAGRPVSALAEQNDLFAKAATARRRGDVPGAVAAFDRLLDEYPACPLAEGAAVERMRLLRSTAPGRAVTLAQQYLVRYPRGFARAEAEAIVSGLP
jgi:ferric-dicitrate binding protein FerR (iron transport regulator)